MKVSQHQWIPGQALAVQPGTDLVFAFGSTTLMSDPAICAAVAHAFPGAHLVGCSTSGEILGEQVHDDSVVLTAFTFAHTSVLSVVARRDAGEDDRAMGTRLGQMLPHHHDGQALKHVFVLADGVHINGTALVEGLGALLPSGVAITGGLAGDGAQFIQTPVWAGEVQAAPASVAVGLYGDRLRVSWGAVGGWHPFGPHRRVTRAEGNVLFSLDDEPALDLYKTYLGPHAADLPGSGLLFPLAIRRTEEGRQIVRSTLGVDEAVGSITFAGDVPEGTYARFMKTNNERLEDGATEAAEDALKGLKGATPEAALLISCVGRRIVMGTFTENELEAVSDVLGGSVPLFGFYSHGEVAPFGDMQVCDLHNQTMTITVMAEDA